MKTYSFIVTVQAADPQTARNFRDDIADDRPDNIETSVGALLSFDAQNTIDDLAGELTALGFGDHRIDISGADAVDVVSDHWVELSLMSSEDHTTNV